MWNDLDCEMWGGRQARLSVLSLSSCADLFVDLLLLFISSSRASLKKIKKTNQPQALLLIYHNLLFTLLPSLTAKMKNAKLRRDFVICQAADTFRYSDCVLSHFPYFFVPLFSPEKSFLVPLHPKKINLTASSWRMPQFLKCISRTDERGAIRQEVQVFATCSQDMWQNGVRACGQSHFSAARRSTITVSCCSSNLAPSHAQ